MKRVLLMDDDRVFRRVLHELFAKSGWQVLEAEDGGQGLEMARQHRPQVIVCDLLMPRCNGFQVCRTIRAEPEHFSRPRIIITSGSAYAVDRNSAIEAGADAFFTKPVSVREILNALGDDSIEDEADPPAASLLARSCPIGGNEAVVRFWGVRGSIPTPGQKTIFYGGNTSCVEVRADGEIIILDAGTGIRSLGLHLADEYKDCSLSLTILITHTHWDHIQGFPFFPPAYNPQNRIQVLSYEGARKGLQATLESQMESPYFPISMQQMPGNIVIKELKEMEFQIGKIQVKSTFTNHPGICVGYRLFTSSGSIAFLPDNELFQRLSTTANKGVEAEQFAQRQDDNLRDFLDGVDVLIIDSQYDALEYPLYVGWGHSCFEDAVDLAMRANVKKLFLFHHDPNHDDEKVSQMLQRAREIVSLAKSPLLVDAAREGVGVALGSLTSN